MSECRINPAKPFERDLLRRLAETVAKIPADAKPDNVAAMVEVLQNQ